MNWENAMSKEKTMFEIGHQLTQSEHDGEVYCRRCGLFSPSGEEQPCISFDQPRPEELSQAA
jgi:hypothetical protein